MGSKSLYNGGGFQEMSKSFVLTVGTVPNVHDLESTQEAEDIRIIRHTSTLLTRMQLNVLLCMQMTLML